ncbi:MGMT family protein [Sediminibacillus massiliensis]|uniref:MGMT family protein n=1 Tax=Sediminibacillus massiliensis TaxID=1926277 RepID=UPI000988886D|nr:methylated-DNA--[protein]-cysteine S-methyltransferase [Sediminibacillus massiliensis]
MKPFTNTVINIIKIIPEGSVMTYGQIAALAGSPRSARQVARILHSMSGKHNLPWHRVVNAKGEVAIKEEGSHEEQKILLEMEGVCLSGSKIDLGIYQYHP